MNGNRFAAFAAATMLAAASIGLAAAPAEADTNFSGCTVEKPAGPKADGRDGSNRVLVKWTVKATCEKGRSIQIYQQRWEEDGPNGRGDDYLGDHYFEWQSFKRKGGSVTLTYTTYLQKTEKNNEELYQKVSFRVTEGLTTSTWTAYERGGASWIFH